MALDGVFLDHLVVVVHFLGITAIGGSIFIGFLFTQPFATAFVMSVYLEKSAAPPSHPGRQSPPVPPDTPVR